MNVNGNALPVRLLPWLPSHVTHIYRYLRDNGDIERHTKYNEQIVWTEAPVKAGEDARLLQWYSLGLLSGYADSKLTVIKGSQVILMN
jgi:hypothetical protein